MKRITAFLAIAGLFMSGVGMLAFVMEGRLTGVSKFHFIAGGICIILFLLTHLREIISTFGSRTARFGALASFYVLVVLGVLAAVNVLGAVTGTQIADLTSTGLYTLAPQTRKVLDSLQGDLDMMAFFNGGLNGLDANSQIDRLLRTFEAHSQKVKLDVIDPQIDPLSAEKYKVYRNGMLVLKYKDKTSKINTITEENITNALIRLLDERPKVTCFVTGHGEASVSEEGEMLMGGLGKLKKLLEGKDYTVKLINLSGERELPPECTVVLVVGPRLPFGGGELVMLDTYLRLGGRLFVAVDSGAQTGLEPLLQRWGVSLGSDVLVEKVVEGRLMNEGGFKATSLKASLSITVQSYNKNYVITQDLSNIHPTQYLAARSVKPMRTATDELKLVPLMWTKEDSWLEKNVNAAIGQGYAVLEPANGDAPGPIPLAVAASLEVPQGYSRQARLVVVGNSQWLTNRMLNEAQNFNSDLFLNMTGWLAGFEQYLAIAPRSTRAKFLNLRREQQQEVFNLAVIFIPELLLLLGALVWWVRR